MRNGCARSTDGFRAGIYFNPFDTGQQVQSSTGIDLTGTPVQMINIMGLAKANIAADAVFLGGG